MTVGINNEWCRPVESYRGSAAGEPEQRLTLVRRLGGTIHYVPLGALGTEVEKGDEVEQGDGAHSRPGQ